MIFFRMFIMTFFFSWTAWGVLDQKDWEEDKAMLSSILMTYRSHYVQKSIDLEKIKRTNPRGFTQELSEVQNASKTFLLWGKFLSALEKSPFNIEEIIKVLGSFPFMEQRIFFGGMMRTCSVLPAKDIYEESCALLNTVHSVIQQYFQEHSDRVRADAGYLNKYEKVKKILWDAESPHQGASSQSAYEKIQGMLSEGEVPECLQMVMDNLEVQKNLFWLPSHQRHADLYRARIENFERFLKYMEDVSYQEVSNSVPFCADEAQASYRPPHLQEAKAGKEETIFSQAQEERVRFQDEREPPEDSKAFGVLKEEEPESPSRTEKFAQALDVFQGAAQEGALELDKALEEQLELQFKQDRAEKLKRKEIKKNVSKKENPSGEDSSLLLNPSAQSFEEDIKDHPTLKRIFLLDINLKIVEFIDFFHKMKLQIKEAEGGITIWFSEEVSKVFHRPHAAGNVVPYIDLTVAKKALKNINIVPRFK